MLLGAAGSGLEPFEPGVPRAEPARVSCYIQFLVVLNDNGSVYDT